MIKTLCRLFRINFVLMKHGFADIMFQAGFLKPLRFIVLLSPYYWLRYRHLPRGQRLRETLEELGPIFVKFGQILSTRRDLLDEDIANELIKLQDKVPPFSGEKATQLIESSLEKKISEIFCEFETKPLASASIAQVHAARLHDGRNVVVKVLRPNVEHRIHNDISLLYTLARFAAHYLPDLKRFKPVEMVAEFEHALLDELDLMREAANASQLRRNFCGSHQLHVPEIYWHLCRKNIMVMERIYGIPISDLNALREAGVDMKLLAHRGVEIFFTQVFRDCFFHADMHPGNIFVDATHPDDPTYIAVDFGIVGSLSDADQYYLAYNLLAFFKRDYRTVAQLHIDSGWVSEDTRVEEFESAIRSVCEPIFERPLCEISFGQVLLRLLQTARRFNMNIQPQLIMLQKTLLNIEGLGRQLYPELNLWDSAKPFLEKWMKQRIGARSVLSSLKMQTPYLAEKLPEIPELVYQFLQSNSQKHADQSNQLQALQQLNSSLAKSERRKSWYGAAAVAFGLSLYTALFPEVVQQIKEIPTPAWLMLVLSFGCFVKAAR